MSEFTDAEGPFIISLRLRGGVLGRWRLFSVYVFMLDTYLFLNIFNCFFLKGCGIRNRQNKSLPKTVCGIFYCIESCGFKGANNPPFPFKVLSSAFVKVLKNR
jgi:hypothetical protein